MKIVEIQLGDDGKYMFGVPGQAENEKLYTTPGGGNRKAAPTQKSYLQPVKDLDAAFEGIRQIFDGGESEEDVEFRNGYNRAAHLS